MLGFDEAVARVLAQTKPMNHETVPLAQGLRRVLATPVIAQMTQPPFSGSAMDGYAVRSEDVFNGAVLTQIGESQAGAGFDGKVGKGQCTRIFTGAPMPEGADAVVMQEVTQADGNKITFEKPVEIANNVRPRGLDFAEGDTLIEAGTFLGPASIALAATGNLPQLSVYRRPTIGLIATGDELMPPGSKLAPGQIVGSNSFGLTALFSPYAQKILDMGNAPDKEELLRQKFADALDGPADIIISTGGASVGDHDLVLPVLKSLGVDIDFWKIAMRPGKPLMFGKKGNKLFFALPGNPVSSYVTAITVVIPAVRAVCGYATPVPPKLHLPLSQPLPANSFRRHFMRGSIETTNGQTHVRPILQMDSSHMSSLSTANALIVVGENADKKSAGDIVAVMPVFPFI